MVLNLALRGISIIGLLIVLLHHVHLEFWEGFLLSACGMMLLGTLYDADKIS